MIQYTRTLFIPVVPYVGDAQVRLALYSPRDQRRLPLAGEDAGQLSYKVATLSLLPHSENVFLLFKDGWHPAEVASDNATVEWQWSKKVGTLAFRNPKKDVIFYLHADSTHQVVRNGTCRSSYKKQKDSSCQSRTNLFPFLVFEFSL